MKIAQTPKFQPITITLETEDEANAFFGIVAGVRDDQSEKLAIKICNWFSVEARL